MITDNSDTTKAVDRGRKTLNTNTQNDQKLIVLIVVQIIKITENKKKIVLFSIFPKTHFYFFAKGGQGMSPAI